MRARASAPLTSWAISVGGIFKTPPSGGLLLALSLASAFRWSSGLIMMILLNRINVKNQLTSNSALTALCQSDVVQWSAHRDLLTQFSVSLDPHHGSTSSSLFSRNSADIPHWFGIPTKFSVQCLPRHHSYRQKTCISQCTPTPLSYLNFSCNFQCIREAQKCLFWKEQRRLWFRHKIKT